MASGFRFSAILINKVLDEYDVVVTTVIGSSDKRLNGRKFKYVIIDEASMLTQVYLFFLIFQVKIASLFVIVIL